MAKAHDEVSHPTLGIGEVADIFIDGETGEERMLVRFPNYPGRKPESTGIFPMEIFPVDALPVVGSALE